MKLTLKRAKAILSPLGVTISRTPFEEYKVRIKGSPVGHGSFHTDLSDAISTGRLMAELEAVKVGQHIPHISEIIATLPPEE